MGLKMGIIPAITIALILAGNDCATPPDTLQTPVVLCPPTTVDCWCDVGNTSGTIVQVNLTTISVVDEDRGIRRCVVNMNPVTVCEERKCIIIPNNNFALLFQKGRKFSPSNYLDDEVRDVDAPTFNRTAKVESKVVDPLLLDSLLSPYYPIEFTYPRSGESGVHKRVKRAYGSNACRVPSLSNSEVTCWKWPNWQTCKQKCIYGFGIESHGDTVLEFSYTCRNSENNWKPHTIRDCEPYMNCKVHLKAPGDLNCVEPNDGPAYCDISCSDYDDYKSHGEVRWKCEPKHHKSLPYCAELEENDIRLKAPDY